MIREMDHDIFQLEISMDDKDRKHVIKSIDKLSHDLLDDTRLNLPSFNRHDFLKVASIAVLHEYIISAVGLNSLSHFNYIVT